MESVNHFEVVARITELEPLRYAPSGVPVLNGLIDHESQAVEAGQSRQVQALIRFVAMGTEAERLATQSVGSQWHFKGFLASPKGRQRLVFHIQNFAQC